MGRPKDWNSREHRKWGVLYSIKHFRSMKVETTPAGSKCGFTGGSVTGDWNNHWHCPVQYGWHITSEGWLPCWPVLHPLPACCPLPARCLPAACSLLIAHCLPTAHCLPAACPCSLPTTCPLPTACPLPACRAGPALSINLLTWWAWHSSAGWHCHCFMHSQEKHMGAFSM